MTRPVALHGIACVGYTRVSTDAQAGEKQTSLADQRAAITALAARLGVTLGHVFEDTVSGSTMEHRPGLRALLASCEASPRTTANPGYVVVLNDSRFGRFEKSEHATYWRVRFDLAGWVLRFAENDETDDDTVRPVMRAIWQSQASAYRKTLKANVLRGTRGQAEQGYWQAKAPFGYRRKVVYPPGRGRVVENDVPKARDEKTILTPHQDEAPIVRAIFERYATGTESITSLLEWAGVAFPDREWTRAAMLRMLSNPAYVGDVVWGRMLLEPGRRTHRDATQWYGRTDAHEPIVSRALFAAAQQRLASNKRRTRGVRSDWILSGIVLCRCGRALTGAGIGGAGPVYGCSTRGAQPSRRCAFPGSVTKHLLESAAIGVIAKELRSAVHRRAMGEALDQAMAESAASTRSSEVIARDVVAVQQRQRRLVAAIEDGTMTAADARDRMTAIRGELARLTAERDRNLSPERFAGRNRLITEALDFASMAKTLQGPALRELVRMWLKRAEFNTSTRELMVEIRRIPAAAIDQPVCGFAAEGEASKARQHETVVRRVIVRPRVA